jgi:hypothetical protein
VGRRLGQRQGRDGERIAERGTHEELLEQGGRYADLYQRQFRASEEPALL